MSLVVQAAGQTPQGSRPGPALPPPPFAALPNATAQTSACCDTAKPAKAGAHVSDWQLPPRQRPPCARSRRRSPAVLRSAGRPGQLRLPCGCRPGELTDPCTTVADEPFSTRCHASHCLAGRPARFQWRAPPVGVRPVCLGIENECREPIEVAVVAQLSQDVAPDYCNNTATKAGEWCLRLWFPLAANESVTAFASLTLAEAYV